jgi:polyisoprenoid-binding protein YceI
MNTTNTTTSDTSQRTSAPTLWTLDPGHTTVGFSVRHLMITNVPGTFDKVAGTVRYDADRPEAAQIEVTIAADSVHTREPQRDEHLRSADFFDAALHPTITFRSRRARRILEAGGLALADEVSLSFDVSLVKGALV